MRRTMRALVAGMVVLAAGCGGGSDTSRSRAEVLRFKDFQFFWTEGAKMELPELPPESAIEIHPSFIIVDAKEGWRILIPMDRIRLINLKKPL
jgi:hypothetical protein